jgi:hypothetical protein
MISIRIMRRFDDASLTRLRTPAAHPTLSQHGAHGFSEELIDDAARQECATESAADRENDGINRTRRTHNRRGRTPEQFIGSPFHLRSRGKCDDCLGTVTPLARMRLPGWNEGKVHRDVVCHSQFPGFLQGDELHANLNL